MLISVEIANTGPCPPDMVRYKKGQNKAIGVERLSRSVKTVETYREHIKLKLDLKDSSALVQHAIQWLKSNS